METQIRCPSASATGAIWHLCPSNQSQYGPMCIIFWRAGPLQYRLSLLVQCSRNPSVSVYQLALLWEAALGFSEFFLKTHSTHLPISWWVIYECTCPHIAECSAVFAPSNFFCFYGWRKSSKKYFADVEKMRQKNSRSTKKASKLMSSKTVLSSGKNVLIDVLHQMESTLRVTEV